MLRNNLKKFLIYSLIIILIFLLDRVSKIYILNLAETSNSVDIYVNSFLNLYLIRTTRNYLISCCSLLVSN